jgi:hypothetical protein
MYVIVRIRWCRWCGISAFLRRHFRVFPCAAVRLLNPDRRRAIIRTRGKGQEPSTKDHRRRLPISRAFKKSGKDLCRRFEGFKTMVSFLKRKSKGEPSPTAQSTATAQNGQQRQSQAYAPPAGPPPSGQQPQQPPQLPRAPEYRPVVLSIVDQEWVHQVFLPGPRALLMVANSSHLRTSWPQ